MVDLRGMWVFFATEPQHGCLRIQVRSATDRGLWIFDDLKVMNPKRKASTDSSKERKSFHYYMAKRVAERCRSCESLWPQNPPCKKPVVGVK